MKIGFISYETPFDRGSFSGTLFYMLSALKNAHQERLGSNPNQPNQIIVLGHYQPLSRLQKKIRLKFLHYLQKLSPAMAQAFRENHKKRYIKTVQRRINKTHFDLLIAPVCSEVVAALSLKDQKLIFVTDATPQYIAEHYTQAPAANAHNIEQTCITKAYKSLYSSQFMTTLAIKEFEAIAHVEQKVRAVRFGLNLDNPPSTATPKAATTTSSGPILELVFVGKEWQRKGGAIAAATASLLNEQGIQCHLTLIGCTPPHPLDTAICTVIPFLDKNIPEQQKQFRNILSQGHFLLLPTQADCTPMVIAEANAFSCPVLANDVGGIASLVSPGKNGYLFAPTATATDYANTLKQVLPNSQHYTALSQQSFAFYQEHLTWAAWANTVLQYALTPKT